MRRDRRLLQMIGMVCLLVSMAGCGSASPIAHQGVAAPTALPAPATPTPLVYREPFNQKVDVGAINSRSSVWEPAARPWCWMQD